MTDLYKFAAQTALRFPSRVGELTVEQLFQLPLKSTRPNGADLDSTARTINGRLKEKTEESFVEDTAADPQRHALTVSLEIVKDVIATKQAENRAAAAKVTRAAERKKLLDAYNAKKDANLAAMPIEELEKKLAELDG